VDGDEYLDSAIELSLPKRSSSENLAPSAIADFRSVVGCFGYIASAFRPDLSMDPSLLSRDFVAPTIKDAGKANATLAWAKTNRYPLVFRKGAEQLTIFYDSAGPNEEGTQGGRICALTDVTGHRVASWIYWESRKVKRVCRSTATA
jgi:hypothetical protein